MKAEPAIILKHIFVLAVILAAFTVVAADPVAATKPNIVYFLVDDMGYADAGFNGSKDFKTPTLDRFAQQGTVLECLKLRAGRKQLAGMTAAVDEAFGQIMAALKEQGMDTNTLVIFSSDNGGPSWNNISGNGILRGGKSDIYEGGFRLGSFVWWPGKIPAGGRIPEPLHVVDWYPTLAKLAGAAVEQKLPLDGKDIWPVLTQGAKTPHDEILLMGSRPGQSAIRVGDWKLLVNAHEFRGTTESKPVELYNLANDPGEKHNLAAEQPERVQALQARLQAYLTQPAKPEFLKHRETEK